MTIVPFLDRVNDVILNPLILLAFALSFLYFIWGVIKFINSSGDPKTSVDARNSIMWGIVGMVIMFSVYGIINFILASFGINIESPEANSYLSL